MTHAGSSPRPRGSFRRQLVVLSAAVTAFAMVLLAVLVQLILAQTSTRSVERVLEERADSVISSAEGASSDSELVVPDSDLDAGVAVYDGQGALVAGSAPSALTQQYADLASTREQRTISVGEAIRIRAQPFTLDSGISGVVVVTERLAPYEQAERYALVVSVGTGVLAVLASAAMAAWVTRRALAPVVMMASTAEEWSEHDLTRRFGLGAPTNEITALGHTLDALLDKVSAAIRSEQRLTSELAHELRTPLTAVQGSADLIVMRAGLDPELRKDVEEIRAGTRRMAETISGLLELARSSSTLADASVSELADAVAEILDSLGLRRSAVAADVPAGIRVAMPRPLVVRTVGPVVENAVGLADHVTVTVVDRRDGFVTVAVDDDGPGVEPGSGELIFEPGRTSRVHGGAGLGLPLARRIARSAGGDVRLEPTDVGTRFLIELPRGPDERQPVDFSRP